MSSYAYSQNIYSESNINSNPVIPMNTAYEEPTLKSSGLSTRVGLDSQGFFLKGHGVDTQYPFLTTNPLPIYDPLIETKPKDIYFQVPDRSIDPPPSEKWISNTELTNLLYNVYTDGTPKYSVGQQTTGTNEMETRSKYMNQINNLEAILKNPDPTIANAIGAKDKLAQLMNEMKLRDPQLYMTFQSGNHESRLEGLQKEMIRLNEQILATNINTNDVNSFIVDVNSFVNKYVDEKDVPEDVLYTYEKIDTLLEGFLKRPDITKEQKDRLRALVPKLNSVVKSTIMSGRMEAESDYLARIKAGREEELRELASRGSVKDIVDLHEKLLTTTTGSLAMDEELERLRNAHIDELRELSRVVSGSDRRTINEMLSELMTRPRVETKEEEKAPAESIASSMFTEGTTSSPASEGTAVSAIEEEEKIVPIELIQMSKAKMSDFDKTYNSNKRAVFQGVKDKLDDYMNLTKTSDQYKVRGEVGGLMLSYIEKKLDEGTIAIDPETANNLRVYLMAESTPEVKAQLKEIIADLGLNERDRNNLIAYVDILQPRSVKKLKGT